MKTILILSKPILLILTLIGLLAGCSSTPTPAAVVPTPVIGEPKIGAPSPQQPGQELGISIDISSAAGVDLSYAWQADGGEIVRGQGSPAITYRTPGEPGIYNVRVTVAWDGHSAERVTMVRVEEEPSPTPTPELPTNTPVPPTDTPFPTPTNTPQPPTSTPPPTSTNTPAPTNTPISPTPTETPQPIPTATVSLPGTETVPLTNLAPGIPWLWTGRPSSI